MSLEELFRENEFTEAEKALVRTAETILESDINKTSVITSLVLGKKIEKAVERLIVSNEKFLYRTLLQGILK
jgi:hypothetical protein